MIAIGGGTRSAYWLRLIATITGVPLHLPEGGEFGAALGVARLGLIADTGANPDDILSKPELGAAVEPVSELRDAYAEAHVRFREAYPAIRAAQ